MKEKLQAALTAIGKTLGHAAVWCVAHPDQIIAIATAAKAAKK